MKINLVKVLSNQIVPLLKMPEDTAESTREPNFFERFLPSFDPDLCDLVGEQEKLSKKLINFSLYR